MRIISLVTAIAVVSILYVLVFERDVLRGFSDGENIEELAKFKDKWSPWSSIATWYMWRSLDPVPVEY